MQIVGEIAKNPGVYKITCIETGKFYVGGTTDCRRRRYEHLYALRKSKHRSIRFQNAFNKYGESSFVFEVLEFCDRDSFRVREQYWIDTLRPFDRNVGFNVTAQAFPTTLGRIPTSETLDKIRATWSRKQDKCAHFRKAIVRSDGQRFVSIREAARQVGCSDVNLRDALKKNRPFQGLFYRYADEVQ